MPNQAESGGIFAGEIFISAGSSSSGWSPNNLEEFSLELRRYEKNSLVEEGRKIIWKTFYEFIEKSVQGDNSPDEAYQMMQTYGSRLICLALATANNQRKLKATAEDFRRLCYAYRDIKASIPIMDKAFCVTEKGEIFSALQGNSKLKKYIKGKEKEFNTWSLESYLFVSRLTSIQNHYTKNVNVYDFFEDADIFLRLDGKLGNSISALCSDKLGLSLEQVLRAIYIFIECIFKNAGLADSERLENESELLEKFGFTVSDIEKVVSFFSIKESALREDWLKAKVLKEPIYYQPYYPLPTYNKIAIQLDKEKGRKFLSLGMDLTIRGFREAFATFLFENLPSPEKGKFGNAIGKIIESHIYNALSSIFGADKVRCLDDEEGSGNKSHADIKVELDKAILLIEVKTAIGQHDALSILRPADIVKIWDRLYSACQQCAASAENLRKEGNKKPIIPIVLVSDYVTAEIMSFKDFAKGFGIYEDLNLPTVNFSSWSEFERILLFSSLESLEDYLAKKEALPNAAGVGGNPRIHNFQYLNRIKAFFDFNDEQLGKLKNTRLKELTLQLLSSVAYCTLIRLTA